MFSEQLRLLRNKCGLSQSELAKRLKVSQQTVAKWEKDGSTPNPQMLTQICDVFGVSSDVLLGRAERKGSKNEEELIKFALFGTTEIDDELYDDVKRLAVLQKQLREEKKNIKGGTRE